MQAADQAQAMAQINQIVEPFIRRAQVRRGNGLTRSMNQSLRSYPQIPEIIRRTMLWLARAEQTLRFSRVQVRTFELYLDLVDEHPDWHADVPVIRQLQPWEVKQIADQLGEGLPEETDLQDHPAFLSSVEFARERKLPYHRFTAAMTIARRIGLLSGHGRIGLESTVREALKRSTEDVRAAGH